MPTTIDKKEPEYITLDFTIRINLAAITLVLAVSFLWKNGKAGKPLTPSVSHTQFYDCSFQ